MFYQFYFNSHFSSITFITYIFFLQTYIFMDEWAGPLKPGANVSRPDGQL